MMLMLKRALMGLVLCGAALTTFAAGFEAKGDSFPAEFTMTSWSSSATTSSLTAEGVVGEGYGKVYLSYEFFFDYCRSPEGQLHREPSVHQPRW